MKKTSFLFLVAGLAILFGLAWLYPVPSVSPFHTEDKPKRTSPTGSGEQGTNQNTETGFRAGEFVFPYYRNPSDTQPAWIFRGTSGTVSRGEQELINVKEPRIKHFPETDNETSQNTIEEVRISGEEGRKRPNNIAVIKNNVLVRTGQGGKLNTRQLYANFETDRLYTRSDHPVTVDRTGLSMEGIGFTGNGQLSRFTLRKDIFIRLSTGQLRNLQTDNQTESSIPDHRYVITGSGPLKVRLMEETNDYRKWKMSIFDDVFLYRIHERGALRQTSDLLHVTLIEAKRPQSGQVASNETGRRSSRLRLETIESKGSVRIEDPNIQIQSDHVTMQRNDRRDVFLLEGNGQSIRLNEQDSSSGNRNRHTQIYVSGRGRIERSRKVPGPKNRASMQRNGTASFNGQVYVRRRGTRLQSRSLSVAFREGRPPAEKQKTSRPQEDPPLRIRMLEAEEQVLFLTDDFASTGDRLTWSPPTDTIQLTSDEQSIVSDLHNRIIAEKLQIDRERRGFRAERSVRTTIRTDQTKGFQLLGASAANGSQETTDASSSASGETTWHLNADRLRFQMRADTDKMRLLKATGNVHISSNRGRARGHQFVMDRDKSKAILQGKQQKAVISQNRHRALADSFRFNLSHRTVVLKGQKRMQIDLAGQQQQQGNPDNLARSELLQITTGAPLIVHRREGRIRVLGRARVLKPGGQMHSRRLNVTFNPETNKIQTVRANGNVFVGDTRGAARGDLLKWDLQEKQLQIRGQPHAVVNRDGNTARFEIISIWNNWNNIRGQRYKWRAPGTIEGSIPDER
jgi:lipopolysaccharide export system protein LptA